MATAPTANDLTRQQLDELDALLQRMLTLPVHSPEANASSTPAPAATNWRMDSSGPALSAAPHLSAPPLPIERVRMPEPPPLAAPVVRAASTNVPEPEPAFPVIVPAPPVERRPAPARAARPAYIAPAARPSHRGESVPFGLLPLVALNWTVDSILGLCGPPGWILRSGFGKNLLGLLGVGLLAYTTAHIASEQGWLTLPFPLPWPR